jgi:ubiquinone/menaquinone biosynthesis C-methylase UbiE
MKFMGDRVIPELRGQIWYEQRHLYAVCLDFARGRDVLELPCGEGYGASLLATVARSVTGIDSDEVSIRHAASSYVATNLTFRTGSATAVPLADDSVDLVVSFETFERVAERREMMLELTRVLRRDGRLLISSRNERFASDKNGDSHEFGARERGSDEFRDLLREFFPRVRLFEQRVIARSAIHPRQGNATSGIVALPEPEYFVALCAKDAADALVDLTSVYLDPTDDMLRDVRDGGLPASNGHAAGAVVVKPGEHEELVARLAEAERERDDVRAHLDVAVVDLQLSEARVAELTRERDSQNALHARAEKERAAVRAELRAAVDELERAQAHRRDLEADRERILAHVARTAVEHETTRGELAKALAARERDAVRIVGLELQALSLATTLEESQGLLRRANAAVRVTGADLLDARSEAGRLRAGWLELEAQVAGLLAALGRSGAVASALGAAVTRAAEAIASLELSRLQLESGLTARLAAAEEKAARASTTAVRLRDELRLVADALALRERRIAVLEGVLRDIADENVRALQRECSRYEVQLANLQASKFFALRATVRNVLPAIAKRAGLRRST